MRAPRDGNTYQDRRQDDRGNRGSQDNLRGAGHPGGRGWTLFFCKHNCPVFLVKLLSNDQFQVEVVKGDAAIEVDEEGEGGGGHFRGNFFVSK